MDAPVLNNDNTLSRLTTRIESDLQSETLDALQPVRMNGKLADVYLQFANSEPALRAYLHMERSLSEGSLDEREREAVKLWVSQQTGCDYCLSIHSMKAARAGISSSAQVALREGHAIGDERIDCLISIASRLMSHPGSLGDEILAKARACAITDENLVDLTMVISTIFFTNITNHINDSKSPLPPAPSLS